MIRAVGVREELVRRFPDGQVDDHERIVPDLEVGRVAARALKSPDEPRASLGQPVDLVEEIHEVGHPWVIEWGNGARNVQLRNLMTSHPAASHPTSEPHYDSAGCPVIQGPDRDRFPAMSAAGTRLWHPFAAMGKVDGHELVLARGEGCRIWDDDGNEYLDATAGLWFANVGHGRVEIADAVAAQLRTLAAHHVFGDHANEPALELAERRRRSRAARGRGGLLRIERRRGGRHRREDRPPVLGARRASRERTVIVSRSFAYHGTNAYGTSLSGIPAVRDGYGTLVEDVAEVAHDDPAGLARTLDELGGRAAAFVGEPMIGAGGVDPAARRLLAGGRADLP